MAHRFFRDDRGATAIEYGLIATLVSIAIITILTTMGTDLGAAFNTIANALAAP
jgi:pilus assembly protein Flp/PilA